MKRKHVLYIHISHKHSAGFPPNLLLSSQVDELISSVQLNVDNEEKVFLASIAWVKHDPLDRKKYVYKLLKHVRLPLISRYKGGTWNCTAMSHFP